MNPSRGKREDVKARAFKKDWQKIAKTYPDFARAYALQQAELVKIYIALGNSICDKVRRGEILMTEEAFNKHCRNFGEVATEIETGVTEFIDCITGPDPSIC